MSDEHIRDMDPEDAYDASDTLTARLAVLSRILDSIRSERLHDPHRADIRRAAALEIVERLEDEIADAAVAAAIIRDQLAVI